MSTQERYTAGAYLAANPTWHVEGSNWKAAQVLDMLERHEIAPETVCEVGCGAGAILGALRDQMSDGVSFTGYDIAPEAIELARLRETDRLSFVLADFTEENLHYDVALVMDVIEHLEDPYTFLRAVRERSDWTILHIPLELCALTTARPGILIRSHERVGHLHFFERLTALQLVRDAGFTVVDSFYTDAVGERVDHGAASGKERVLNVARRGLKRIDTDLAVRLLGGHSLLALAR